MKALIKFIVSQKYVENEFISKWYCTKVLKIMNNLTEKRYMFN